MDWKVTGLKVGPPCTLSVVGSSSLTVARGIESVTVKSFIMLGLVVPDPSVGKLLAVIIGLGITVEVAVGRGVASFSLPCI